MISHIATGLLTVWLRFPRLTPAQKQQRVMAWSQELLARLAMELIVKGRPPAAGPLLLVANHISWIDIASVHAVCYCRFVAKSDMKRWPVIGTLTAGIGTLFIERESRRDAMRVVHHMADSLRAGDVLAVFPEGTTGDGHGLLPFHANLIQAAIAAQAQRRDLNTVQAARAEGISWARIGKAARHVGAGGAGALRSSHRNLVMETGTSRR